MTKQPIDPADHVQVTLGGVPVLGVKETGLRSYLVSPRQYVAIVLLGSGLALQVCWQAIAVGNTVTACISVLSYVAFVLRMTTLRTLGQQVGKSIRQYQQSNSY